MQPVHFHFNVSGLIFPIYFYICDVYFLYIACSTMLYSVFPQFDKVPIYTTNNIHCSCKLRYHVCATALQTFLSEEIVDRQIADGLIPQDLKEKIIFVLLRKHRHQTKKPIHRSLADMGKSSNTSSSMHLLCVSISLYLCTNSSCLNNVHHNGSCTVLITNCYTTNLEIPSSLMVLTSIAAAPSDRSPHVNLSRSTSSASGIHRSTEDLRSRQSSSLGRLRESQYTTQCMPFAILTVYFRMFSSCS